MIRILKMLKIFDDDNMISLSNILLMVIIIKIALVQVIDWTVISGLTLSLIHSNVKKVLRKQAIVSQDNNNTDISAMKAQADELAQQVALIRLGQ